MFLLFSSVFFLSSLPFVSNQGVEVAKQAQQCVFAFVCQASIEDKYDEARVKHKKALSCFIPDSH
jgi:hypothetical protein